MRISSSTEAIAAAMKAMEEPNNAASLKAAVDAAAGNPMMLMAVRCCASFLLPSRAVTRRHTHAPHCMHRRIFTIAPPTLCMCAPQTAGPVVATIMAPTLKAYGFSQDQMGRLALVVGHPPA